VSRAVHEKLVSIARAVSYPEGARLVRQGEASRGAYLIETGRAEAEVTLPGGGTLPVASFGEGDMFGEMALIERGVCTASVAARSAVAGWFVARDDFRALVASRDPAALEVQREITRILAAKLRALNAKVRGHPAAEDRPARSPGDRNYPSKRPSFDWKAFLPVLPCFEGFDAYEIEELVGRASVRELERGAPLFRPGEAASACYIVVRGAVEVCSRSGGLERRVAVAGPGEIVGYLAVLAGEPHAAEARVRETACLLVLPAAQFLAVYNADSGSSVSLQHAIHKSLLRSMGRTNTQLTRLISAARLRGAQAEGNKLEISMRGNHV
jgi:CRP-like cAMP-binding protein